MKYICLACQYIYDPEVGDVDGGIDPGTAFDDLLKTGSARFAASAKTCLNLTKGR